MSKRQSKCSGVTCFSLVNIIIFWRFNRWRITPRIAAFLRVYGDPHERLYSLPVSVFFPACAVRKKPTKRSETRIESGSRDPESNVFHRSAISRKNDIFYDLRNLGEFLTSIGCSKMSNTPTTFRASPEKLKSEFFFNINFMRSYECVFEMNKFSFGAPL